METSDIGRICVPCYFSSTQHNSFEALLWAQEPLELSCSLAAVILVLMWRLPHHPILSHLLSALCHNNTDIGFLKELLCLR